MPDISDEKIRLILDLVKGGQTDEAIKSLEKFRTNVKDAGKDLDETTNKQKGLGQSALQASYTIQDFTSQLGTRGLAGALGAVQNNIPGILASMGAGAGLSAGAQNQPAMGALET